jgi:hypothetical protein
MASKKKNAANRRNARKSTGPKTPEGKAKSSMNALRHGLRASTILIRGEKPEDFDRLRAGLQDHYQPQNPAEQHLVDQAVIAQWKLVRSQVFEDACDKDLTSNRDRADNLARMTQVQCRLERTYFKAYKELDRIKGLREKQAEPAKQPKKPPAKSEEPEPPKKYQLTLVDPGTGARKVLFRSENGKPVDHFSDA